MSAVDTSDIPIIVDYKTNNMQPMDIDYDTGFPFDRDFDSDPNDSLRSKLDDIAKRHPQFAEHLQGFPRRRSNSRTEEPEEYLKRFERPFGGSARFERFGFPFDRDEFDSGPHSFHTSPPHSSYSGEDYNSEPKTTQPTATTSTGTNTEPECQPQQQSQYHQGTTQPGHSGASSGASQAQEQPRGRARNIQQSNTVDLGQKQEEELNDRNQRSMSAPPTENRQGQRYVSSINIPISRETGGGEYNSTMGKQQSTTHGNNHTSTPSNNTPTERVIPIHVEGRDDPVMPRNVHQTYTQPQTERIFGQRPEHFTQFVREPRGHDWSHPFERHGFPEEEFMRRHHTPSQSQYTPHRAGSPQPQAQQHRPSTPQGHKQSSQEHPPPQKSATPPPPPPNQQQSSPPPPKQKVALGPVEQIQAIQKDVSELLKQVEEFPGKPRDKQYLYLEEMLTRNLLKLDNVDTQGQDTIRTARKEAIKCIEKGIGELEARAAANVKPVKASEDKMEAEQQSSKVNEDTMDVVSEGSATATDASEQVKIEETVPTTQEIVAQDQVVLAKPEEESTALVVVENVANKDETSSEKNDEMAVEESVVNVKDAIAKLEESNNNNTCKDDKMEVKEAASDVKSTTNDETETVEGGTAKTGEKKEKKKIKKKLSAADKEKIQ